MACAKPRSRLNAWQRGAMAIIVTALPVWDWHATENHFTPHAAGVGPEQVARRKAGELAHDWERQVWPQTRCARDAFGPLGILTPTAIRSPGPMEGSTLAQQGQGDSPQRVCLPGLPGLPDQGGGVGTWWGSRGPTGSARPSRHAGQDPILTAHSSPWMDISKNSMLEDTSTRTAPQGFLSC